VTIVTASAAVVTAAAGPSIVFAVMELNCTNKRSLWTNKKAVL